MLQTTYGYIQADWKHRMLQPTKLRYLFDTDAECGESVIVCYPYRILEPASACLPPSAVCCSVQDRRPGQQLGSWRSSLAVCGGAAGQADTCHQVTGGIQQNIDSYITLTKRAPSSIRAGLCERAHTRSARTVKQAVKSPAWVLIRAQGVLVCCMRPCAGSVHTLGSGAAWPGNPLTLLASLCQLHTLVVHVGQPLHALLLPGVAGDGWGHYQREDAGDWFDMHAEGMAASSTGIDMLHQNCLATCCSQYKLAHDLYCELAAASVVCALWHAISVVGLISCSELQEYCELSRSRSAAV